MGIEDEDLGEGTVGERLARAEQLVVAAERQRDAYKQAGASAYELAEYEKQIEELKRKQGEAQLDLLRDTVETQKALVKELELQLELGEVSQEEVDRQKALLKIKDEQLKKDQKSLDLAERRRAIQEKLDDFSEGFIKRMTGLEEGPGNTLIGNMIFDPEGTVGSLGKEFTKLANPLNITKNLSLKIAEATMALALEQDQAVVNFRRATGAGGEFDGTIRNLERSLFTAGVTAAEAGQSVQSLFLNVTDFTEMSTTQQKELAKTTAILNELGVSAEITAQNLQFATKALGMSTSQAEELQRELFTFAQDLGVSADKIAQDFQKFGPQIAALGSEGVDAFKQLEMQAKATGLAIDELVNITEQFNKFDTAAQAVGKLNAMLGGPFLNTLEMVNETNPAKRMELLKNAVDKAGLSFDTMDFYQRKAIASSMGLNEQQLALLMRGEFDVGPPPKTAEELAELAKQTAQFNTVMEELMQAGRALAVSLGPLISSFKALMQFLSPMLQVMSVMPGAIFGMGAAFMYLKRVLDFTTLSMASMSAAEKRSLVLFAALGSIQLIAQIYELAGGFYALLAAFAAVTAGIAAMVFAEKASVILGGLGLVTMLVSGLVHAFTVGNSPSLVQAFMMVAAAIPFMTLAMLALMPLLPALMIMVPPLVFAFVMLADAMSEIISDQFVNNLQLMAVEIANIVDSINELSATKAVAFTASMAATGVAATAKSLAGGAVAAVTTAVAGTPSPGTAAPATAEAGPPPTININLSIDGSEFATVVNSVEVSRYNKGTQSEMYNSIIGMIEQGFAKG